MNIRRPSYPLLAVFSLALAACGNEIVEPLDVDVIVEAVQYHPGEFSAGPSRVLTMEVPSALADDVSALVLRGRLRASRVDWIADRCGPIIYWDFRGNEAFVYGLELLQGLPLTSEADVDAYFEDDLPPTFFEPGEPWPKPAPDAPREIQWALQLGVPPQPFEASLRGSGDEGVVSSMVMVATSLAGDWQAWFAPEELDEASKALEVLSYMAEFNDRMTRRYLEEHRPKCLLD